MYWTLNRATCAASPTRLRLNQMAIWTPDGRQFARCASCPGRPSTGGDTEVFVMSADGNGLRGLTFTPGVGGSPHAR